MKIKGQQLYIFLGENRKTLLPVGFSTECSLILSAETVEGSRHGNARRVRPGKKSWRVTTSQFCGSTSFANEVSPALIGQPISIAITILQRDLVEAGIDLNGVSPSAVETIVGRAIITDISARGVSSALATKSVECIGSGGLGLLRDQAGFPYILPLDF